MTGNLHSKRDHLFFLVDDDHDDQMLLDAAIKKLSPGAVTRTFRDGIELIEHLVMHSEQPDVVFLDIHMPVADGRITLKLLRKDKYFQSIPVVVLSTRVDLFDRERVLKLGATAYYSKPSRTEELEHIVRKVKREILGD